MVGLAFIEDTTLAPSNLIDSLVDELRAALPPECHIVSNVIIRRHPFDIIVICPQGLLVVLYIKEWGGVIHPAFEGDWKRILPSGEEEVIPNPGDEVDHSAATLTSFLEEKFPDLHPLIDHVLVLANPTAEVAKTDVTWPQIATPETLGAILASMNRSAAFEPLDPKVYRKLVDALQAHPPVSVRQKSRPFIFRRGHVLGSGHKVYTVQEAIQHMDQHPDDGILHLRNGTLAQWFTELGERDLARLVQEVTREPSSDPRAQLETFLLRTGMVERPRLVTEPAAVDLGPVLIGQQVKAQLRLRKGRGRGYLFGRLRSSQPFLRIDPLTFSGAPQDVSLVLDTQALPITDRPQEAAILVDSSAGEEPIPVPVRFWVMGLPTPLTRFLLRPLASMLLVGLAGLGIGLGLAASGAPQLAWPDPLQSWMAFLPAAFQSGWPLLLALLGGGVGLWHGLVQPVAWPVQYAARRWLIATARWWGILTVLALVALLSWQRYQVGEALSPSQLIQALLFSLAGALLLGSVANIRRGRSAQRGEPPPIRPLRRQALGLAAAAAVILLLVASLQRIPALEQTAQIDQTVETVQVTATERMSQWEASLNQMTDQLLLRYYDRRAPSRSVSTADPGQE